MPVPLPQLLLVFSQQLTHARSFAAAAARSVAAVLASSPRRNCFSLSRRAALNPCSLAAAARLLNMVVPIIVPDSEEEDDDIVVSLTPEDTVAAEKDDGSVAAEEDEGAAEDDDGGIAEEDDDGNAEEEDDTAVTLVKLASTQVCVFDGCRFLYDVKQDVELFRPILYPLCYGEHADHVNEAAVTLLWIGRGHVRST